MDRERRAVLVGAGTLTMGAVAGCLSSASPDPRAVDMYYPEPRVVDVDSEYQSGDRHDFTVEIENTGASGTSTPTSAEK